MKIKTFTEETLDKAEIAKSKWKAENPNVKILKDFPPTIVCNPAGRFAKKEDGKIVSVTLSLQYED